MEDTTWQYQETLRRCRALLVKEYTIKPQVYDLVLYLHQENHITYNQTQDINETVLTTDKMQRLIGILIDCKSDIKAAYDCLRKQMSDCGRSDIADKLDETLEKVRSEPKPTEEEVPDMVDRIRSDITSFPMTEIHRCLTKVADYIIPQGTGGPHSTDHHKTVAPEDMETQEAAHTKLVMACERGDVEKVEEILTKTPDCVNITNKNGETILMLSCSNANVNVVKTLLKCQVIDVNMQDYNGRTALMKSVIRGDIEVLSMMLDYKNLELSTRDHAGVTYLCYVFGAEAVNFLPGLQEVLKLYTCTQSTLFRSHVIKFISTKNELQKAINWVKVDKVVKCLLSKNNVNHTDLLKTCLLLENPDVVSLVLQSLGQEAIDKEIKDYCYSITASINPANAKVLLECGLIDVKDLTTLQVEAITESVMRHGCHELCAYFYKMIRDSDVNEALKTALFLQSISPHILSDILEGMNYDFQKLHITDSVGNTVFAILCKRGDPDIVRLLLNNDAQVNVANEYRETPLILACESGNTEIVDLLLKKRADLNIRTKWGQSPLLIACICGHPDIVRLLLNNDAQVNVVDEHGVTSLFGACMSGNTEIVDLLLKKRADLNIRTKWGESPLMIACRHGYPDIVRLLLNNGAQVNEVDEDGYTPLFGACRSGNIEVVKLLLMEKADINACNKSRLTPLQIARVYHRDSIVELLLEHKPDVVD